MMFTFLGVPYFHISLFYAESVTSAFIAFLRLFYNYTLHIGMKPEAWQDNLVWRGTTSQLVYATHITEHWRALTQMVITGYIYIEAK